MKVDTTFIEEKRQKPDKSSGLSSPVDTFPLKIVGLGASAGGLEAFEQFLKNVPADSDMAFVLIQHLAPTHDSMLTDILQRFTEMKVAVASEGVEVVRNCVYVIPPNRDMTISNGCLQLNEPKLPHGHRMPIDCFLRTLAEDRGELAIGIVLSGTGADGTLGLRAILGAGGVTLVQKPGEAKYRGMPESAITNGYATHVMSAREMGDFLAHGMASQSMVLDEQADTEAPQALQQILQHVFNVTGNDFSEYKKSTINRRIERRMQQHNIADTTTYARYLKENAEEVKLLFSDLLINVTSFFRDPEAFETLKQDILPALLADEPEQYVLRIWIAACSTGEEAYSIAMVVREFLDTITLGAKVMIFATDLDDHALAVARAGRYPLSIAQDILPDRLERFFVKEGAYYWVRKAIREMVIFAAHNIIKDPPFTKLDLLCCRNLMIYFEPHLQKRLLPMFDYALKPGGVLFLSPSESIGNHVELFRPVNRKWKFYVTTQIPSYSSTTLEAGANMAKIKIDNLIERISVGKGKEVKVAKEIVTPGPVKRRESKGGTTNAVKRIEQLEHDLAYTKENLRATVEEQLSSNEELKSSNEELQSINEEMQSVNEELVTVNAELHNKIEELANIQNDMKNLFDNITVGTIFLNENLTIRRFTRDAVCIYPLVDSDLDRPLDDFKSTLLNVDLLSDARQVLSSLLPRECEVCTRDGHWFLARIQPYRTMENRVEGVVMTFTPIDKLIKAHLEVLESRDLAEAVVATVRHPLLVLDGVMRVISVSRYFYKMFQVGESDTIGRSIFELGNRQWDIPALRQLLETILMQNHSFDNYIIEHDFPIIGHRKLVLNARRMVGNAGDTKLILLAMEQVA